MAGLSRRAVELIKRAVQTPTVHRVRVIGGSAPAATDTYATLITTKDEVDYDKATDGTNVAECEVGSRVLSLDLYLQLVATNPGDRVELLFHKDEDSALGTSFTVANLFTADVSATVKMVRKNSISYKLLLATSGDGEAMGMRLGGRAMARLKTMRENDKLVLLFSVPAGDAFTYHLTGTIITAK